MNTEKQPKALADHIADASKMVAPSNLKQLADSFPELNHSNYGAEDVDKLHNWALEVVQAITTIDQEAESVVPPEPFGYFKPFVDGWMDCKETDEGARPLYEAPQQKADALDAERYRWLRDEWLGNEPEAVNMERARGQRGLDAAIDAAIAATKENK